MYIKTIEDVEKFNEVVKSCKGDVWLQSVEGDRYNLKSELSRYIAVADMIRDEAGKLELFTSLKEDESKFFELLGNTK